MNMKQEKNEYARGDIVVSLNGKDKGKTFLVVKTENEHSYIANGRRRKAEKPKKKKNKHLEIIGKTDCSVLTNKEIKKKINEFLKKKEGER